MNYNSENSEQLNTKQANEKNFKNINTALQKESKNIIEIYDHEQINNNNQPSDQNQKEYQTEQDTDRKEEGLIQPLENCDKDLNKIKLQKDSITNDIYITPHQNEIPIDPLFEELKDQHTSMERKNIIVNT